MRHLFSANDRCTVTGGLFLELLTMRKNVVKQPLRCRLTYKAVGPHCRPREGGDPDRTAHRRMRSRWTRQKPSDWIPAFAGMTESCSIDASLAHQFANLERSATLFIASRKSRSKAKRLLRTALSSAITITLSKNSSTGAFRAANDLR